MAELPDRRRSFIDWYLAAVEAAGLTDKRYGVKGMNVWTPYGFAARRALDAVLVAALEASGSRAVEFPTLIPLPEFQKEADHIKGFTGEVYWVTRGGATELDVPLVLRPTSETAMYPIFAVWIRSHRDLPLTVYQIVNTFRYETKTTRPFLRVREIHFLEEHTCQVDEAAATARVAANLASFAGIAARLGLPYLALRRPDWDKFAGAHYSVALDIPVGGGRTLQIGSIHHYRENFARPYGIRFEAPDGSQRFVHQTTFGLSERLLGALVAVHGDAKGVVFPSAIAPHAVVVVPIPGDGSAGVGPYAADVAARLAATGLRVHVDDGAERPGAKYYRWETCGAPLRLEIGRREAERRTATWVDRLGHRGSAGPDDVVGGVRAALAAFDAALAERARAGFAAEFAPAGELAALAGSEKVRYFPWCGRDACGHEVERALDGALLGTAEGPFPLTDAAPGACLACGATEATRWAVAGRPL